MAFSSHQTFYRLRTRIADPVALIVNPVESWLPADWEYSKRNDTFFNAAGEVAYDLAGVWTTTEVPVLENYSEDVGQQLFEVGIIEVGNLNIITLEEHEELLRTGYRTIYRGEEHIMTNIQPRYDLCFWTITRVGKALNGNTI